MRGEKKGDDISRHEKARSFSTDLETHQHQRIYNFFLVSRRVLGGCYVLCLWLWLVYVDVDGCVFVRLR
jgi:hypothetical protein